MAPTTDSHTASPIDPEDALGLSACQGILQEHRGQISRERREDGTIILRVLPSSNPVRTFQAQGIYCAGAVAISTVRLSCPQAA